ncbi:MAG: phospholipase D family protein [Nitrospirae bacterium]|nr:phospholipase D family protein [Nitrospirota bacterium]MBI3606312.1 phospholipase D family protein [Nitrospirota bacterium]
MNRAKIFSSFFFRLSAALVFTASLFFSEIPQSFAGEIQTYYSPGEHLQEHLLSLYQKAEKTIFIACFNITSRPIVKALIQAKKRGIDVRVITDQGELENKSTRQAVKALVSAGIPVKVNRHDGLMHIKQAVIDDQINTSGSFNQTWSAENLNDERLDVITDPSNTKKAKEKFLKMWNDPEGFRDLEENF